MSDCSDIRLTHLDSGARHELNGELILRPWRGELPVESIYNSAWNELISILIYFYHFSGLSSTVARAVVQG